MIKNILYGGAAGLMVGLLVRKKAATPGAPAAAPVVPVVSSEGLVRQIPPADACDPRVDTLMPESGPGFFCNNDPAHRWGRLETVQTLLSVAAEWDRRHPTGPRIIYRDLSRIGGGQLPGHRSHRHGVDVDIPILSSTGEGDALTQFSPNYSRDLTAELAAIIRAAAPVQFLFFNDYHIEGATPLINHDDHMHVRFVYADELPRHEDPCY